MISINWPAAGVIVGILTLMFAYVTWRQKQQKDEITESVDQLKIVLLEKLETKDNVNQLRVDIARMSTEITALKERMK